MDRVLGDAVTLSLDNIGLRNKIDQASNGHDYLHRYQQLLAKRQVQKMAIIMGTRPIAIANTFAEFLPNATITAISYKQVTEADHIKLRPNVQMYSVDKLLTIHHALAAHGPFDVLVEDSPNRKSLKREIFRQFFPHVRDGGLYIAEDLHAGYIPSLLDDDKEELWQMISRLLAYKASVASQAAESADVPTSNDERNLAAAMGTVEFDGKFLVIENNGNHAIKLRHAEANTILQRRFGDTWGRVVKSYPAFTYTSDALVFANKPDVAGAKFPNPISVPALHVREYVEAVAAPRQRLQKESLFLPDTFRLGLTGRLANTALDNVNHHFASSVTTATGPKRLRGSYYYLDLEYTRHFGHFMTEVIPRLYAWDEAKAANPDLKVLISSSRTDGRLLPYQMEILEAYGIGEHEIRTFDSPVAVESLIAPAPLFHNGRYVHPLLRETFERLGKGLATEASPFGPRIFISRKPGMWRECLNMQSLEAVFIERGFDIVYPEDLSLREQASVFASATTVAGYIGSSLYSAMFTPNPIDIIGFVNTAYQSTNEYFIATALGHRMHMFWCDDIRGNRDVDSSGRKLAKTNYDYEFDFEADGAALSRLLDSLGERA